MTQKQLNKAAKEVRAFSESCPPIEQGIPSSICSASSNVSDRRRPQKILSDWKVQIQEERLSERSCQKHGMPDQSKWHEGKADALERCADELEFLILPYLARRAALLGACESALRSYQYGNSSTELAEEIADKVLNALAALNDV